MKNMFGVCVLTPSEYAHLVSFKDIMLDTAAVNWSYNHEHETDPRKCINDIINWETEVALDPAVSSGARELQRNAMIKLWEFIQCNPDAKPEQVQLFIEDQTSVGDYDGGD